MTIVHPYGPSPCDWMAVGEAPGRVEANTGRPFSGPTGDEQARLLRAHGVSIHDFRLDNVVREYHDGNPDPTAEQIEFWTANLKAEIARVRPRVILAVGRFAMRWFLGEDAELDACRGMPHRAGAFDTSRADRAPEGCIVIPVTHPAAGFHQVDARAVIADDYARACQVIKLVRSGNGHRVVLREDPYAGGEQYYDVCGTELEWWLAIDRPEVIGLDTEGTPDAPWSIQISTNAGTGYVLRVSQPDFAEGVSALQYWVDRGTLVVTHDAGTPSGCMYDTQMCRAMGLELRKARGWNTMYAAYILRLEPKGLKDLAWRWCGMRMANYMGLIGDIGKRKQMDYLVKVAACDWGAPEPRFEESNDGTFKLYKPQPLHQTVTGILNDVWSGKVNKDGPVDPYKRWYKIPKWLRRPAEERFGRLPVGTLDDVDLETAVRYAAMDADGTRRLKFALEEELQRHRLIPLMETGMKVLPILEEMQSTGMPASRAKFVELSEHVTREMRTIQSQLSHRYFDGRPFNPNSPPQVRTLLRRQGLRGAKRAEKSGEVSTSKKSIEHHRAGNPAIAGVFDWRERSKIKSTYATPVLEAAEDQEPPNPSNPDFIIVRGRIKPVTVETRRLSMEDPSLLNQPSRTKLGKMVRGCYVTDPTTDEVFLAVDYSAQEMRVAAHVSGDELLCQLFREGRDPHTEAAARIFGVSLDQVDKDTQRTPTKTANFGILYGLSGSGLEDLFRMFGLHWPVDRCQELIDDILRKVYPGLSRSIREWGAAAERDGKVQDLFGMIRYLPAARSRDRKEAAEAKRQAFSHVIQGSAQGMMQNAMAWLDPYIVGLRESVVVDVRWALQVHDEVIFRLPESGVEVVEPLVVEGLVEHSGIRLKVPIAVESKYARNWKDLK